jgi:hypothetical protein
MPARVLYFCNPASYYSKQDKIKNKKRRNKSFERVEQFRYLENNLIKQHSFLEEHKNRLKSGNACCHSVQNGLSSSLLSFGAEWFVFQFAFIKYKGYDNRTVIFLLLCGGGFTADPWFKTKSQICSEGR